MVILALNTTTVKLITSTQIITSVFSVVKELVENSLDAGAKNIEINLTDNGVTLIEIRDDGCGISVTDVPSMAMPHYTSKISDFSDLDSLTTYGFRGEALNAICRVAEVTITTKTVHDETAKSYTMDNNGNIKSTELSPRFVGTTVRVKKLFENLPVRRQLITNTRKSKQEIKMIENVLKSLSICQPVVRMSFRVNNNLVFLKPSCSNIKEALSHFVGSKIVGDLEWIRNEDSEVKLQLMIPKQQLADPQLVYVPNEQYLIINYRPVKYKQFEKLINERVSDHFGGKVPPKKHPVYMISITVAPSEVDVNLEPNKTSVLLKNQDTILKTLDKILVDFYNLRDENMRPDMSVSNASIDTSAEYHDFTQNLGIGVESLVCKKSKLNNNKPRARDFIVDANTDSEGKRKVADKRSLNNGVALDINSGSIMEENVENMRMNRNPETELCEKNEDIQRRQNKSSGRDSIHRLLKTFPGPILSDSDSESIADTEVPKKAKESELIIGHAVRPTVIENEKTTNDSETFAISPVSTSAVMICRVQMGDEANAVEPNASNDESERLSQLPIVDLGEDFDFEAILERPPSNKLVKLEDISHELQSLQNDNDLVKMSGDDCNSLASNSTLELWSRGHIPGLKGSTDVSTYNDVKNTGKSTDERQNKGEPSFQTIYHTGFSKFSYEIRAQVIEENPGAALPTIGKILANRWKELSPEERGYYRDLALEEKKNAEAEKKRLKNKRVSQEEADKNKARLVQMLESMKKTKNNKKICHNDRTIAPWDINIQDITKNFISKPISEAEGTIGPLTDKIWAVKCGRKICAINSADAIEPVNPKESVGEEMTIEKTTSILQSWLKEKNTKRPEIMLHTIHNISSS